ncbi:SMI1/KNR4 family protein [Alteromonas sp. C1M14]|uniref:SMI1/KNR4 family protein n=1 Tax=Alteromonas sp. C1M14 TaxID=2841567 RepID=UPI001C09841A|nr:SMI1/KNR4 family protein [Alteromonas sp. C1M14]MBU2978760.1 SMI1/KNR4 family protein [Alteromonas sp. C1M14]
MNPLHKSILQTLPNPMSIPEPLAMLFDWIESNGFAEDTEIGRVGYLYPNNQMRHEWTDAQRPGGTLIEFYAEEQIDDFYFVHKGIKDRLRIFARTGGDGSVAAFWLDDNNEQKIVHIGSGSGSTLACVLAENAVDFLRLIAIGYDEVCWNEDFDKTPFESFKENEFTVKPNLKFQDWVTHEFNTSIPKTALEIVKNPAEFGDENSGDIFCEWLEANGA